MSRAAWAPEPHELPALITLVTAILCYTLFHLGMVSPRLRAWLVLRAGAERDPGRASLLEVLVLKRAMGVFWLGLVPLTVAALADTHPGGLTAMGLTLAGATDSLAMAGATLVVLLPGVWLNARRPWFWTPYPEIRHDVWTPRLMALNALTWAAYLLAYELFFRGWLLFALEPGFGRWPAIAVMTALYVAVHLPKNPAEALGSLPLGVLFGATALWTGSILGPFVVHVVMAVATDALAVAACPQRRLSWRG